MSPTTNVAVAVMLVFGLGSSALAASNHGKSVHRTHTKSVHRTHTQNCNSTRGRQRSKARIPVGNVSTTMVEAASGHAVPPAAGATVTNEALVQADLISLGRINALQAAAVFGSISV